MMIDAAMLQDSLDYLPQPDAETGLDPSWIRHGAGMVVPPVEHSASRAPQRDIMQFVPWRGPNARDSAKWLKNLGAIEASANPGAVDRMCGRAPERVGYETDCFANFDRSVTFCFTRERLGLAPHHRSAPFGPLHFAEFCAEMIELHAPTQRRAEVAR